MNPLLLTPLEETLIEVSIAHRNANCVGRENDDFPCTSFFHSSRCWIAFNSLPLPNLSFG